MRTWPVPEINATYIFQHKNKGTYQITGNFDTNRQCVIHSCIINYGILNFRTEYNFWIPLAKK